MPEPPAPDDAIELLRQQIAAATDAAERLVREAGMVPGYEPASNEPARTTAPPRGSSHGEPRPRETPIRGEQPRRGGQPPRGEESPRRGQPPRGEEPPRGGQPPPGEQPPSEREPGDAPPSGRDPSPTGPPPPRRPPPGPPPGPPPSGPPPRAGSIPESGWDAPESHREAASELQALSKLFATVREMLPEDVQEQLTELIRQLLLVLRAMIDWAVARIERGPRGREIQVEDIPIA